MSIVRDFLVIVLLLAVLFSGPGKDDSDPPGAYSGFGVYTDHLTGVQYVGGIFQGFTPRLNADGSIHTVQK